MRQCYNKIIQRDPLSYYSGGEKDEKSPRSPVCPLHDAVTLCACANSGEKEFEAAKALYDAGDYEDAIEALQNIGHYAEITGMIADA